MSFEDIKQLLSWINVRSLKYIVVAITWWVSFFKRFHVQQLRHFVEAVWFTDTSTARRNHETLFIVIQELQILFVQVLYDFYWIFVVLFFLLHLVNKLVVLDASFFCLQVEHLFNTVIVSVKIPFFSYLVTIRTSVRVIVNIYGCVIIGICYYILIIVSRSRSGSTALTCHFHELSKCSRSINLRHINPSLLQSVIRYLSHLSVSVLAVSYFEKVIVRSLLSPNQ